MAALKLTFRVAENFGKKFSLRGNVILCRVRNSKKRLRPIFLFGTAASLAKKEAVLEPPDASRLSTEYLIKSSSIAATEQTSNLITFIATALDKAEKQYAEGIFALVILMEYKLQVLGHKEEEERIWTLILEARALVSKAKKTKQDLDMMMMSAVNMLNAAAEIAYMAGEELSGGSAGDRLNKIEAFIKQSKLESEKAEQRLREAEAKTVEIESKRAEEQRQRQEKENNEKEQKGADEKEQKVADEKDSESNNLETVLNITDKIVENENDETEELIT